MTLVAAATLACGLVIATAVGRHLASRGRLVVAALLVGANLNAIALSFAWLLPFAFPTLEMMPLASVALVLPYLEASRCADSPLRVLPPALQRHASGRSCTAPCCVLVVDDESDARELIEEILSQHGAQVATAGSVSAALTALDASPVDVLVSDIGMPSEDGYALIRRVRERGVAHGSAIPAIALTAFAGSDDRMRILAAGFHRHLSKPFGVADLVNAVAELGVRARRADAQQNESLHED